ncbi:MULTISPECIES: cation:proton antiporter [unclassified Streptomyces]|uniref:cation:proton antiporter domain-containing protein n=1 Tax=unclassified Streptomyces TaxID=2593676 RepID=UPI003328673D
MESGLNDGLTLPFFVMALAAAGGGHDYPGVAETLLRALLLSGAIGIAAGWAGASLLSWSLSRGWSSSDWRQFMAPVVSVIAYVPCVMGDGSGFIGAWVAGLAFGGRMRRAPTDRGARVEEEDPTQSTRFTARLGLLLASLSFLCFGAVVLGPVLQHLTWRSVVYALASLTVIRMLPVALSLMGTGLRPASVAYIGWFGPQGLASRVFGLIAFEEHLPGGDLAGGGHRRDGGPEHPAPRSLGSLPRQPLRRMVHQNTPRQAEPAGERTRQRRSATLKTRVTRGRLAGHRTRRRSDTL